jgi:hypothetical protein
MGCEYDIQEYLEMLKTSLNYVQKYHDLVAKDLDDNYLKLNRKYQIILNYHIFSFSQIVYTICEKLCDKYPPKKNKIYNFFKNSRSVVKYIFVEGQKWKHHNKKKKVNKGLNLHNHVQTNITGVVETDAEDNSIIKSFSVKCTFDGKRFSDGTIVLNTLEESYDKIKDFIVKLS